MIHTSKLVGKNLVFGTLLLLSSTLAKADCIGDFQLGWYKFLNGVVRVFSEDTATQNDAWIEGTRTCDQIKQSDAIAKQLKRANPETHPKAPTSAPEAGSANRGN